MGRSEKEKKRKKEKGTSFWAPAGREFERMHAWRPQPNPPAPVMNRYLSRRTGGGLVGGQSMLNPFHAMALGLCRFVGFSPTYLKLTRLQGGAQRVIADSYHHPCI